MCSSPRSWSAGRCSSVTPGTVRRRRRLTSPASPCRPLGCPPAGCALLPLLPALLVAAPLGGYPAAHGNPERVVQGGLLIRVVGPILLRRVLNASPASADRIAPLAIYAAGLGLRMSQLG